eukprot:11207355-Ditylum_brightwellii.AAC.1
MPENAKLYVDELYPQHAEALLRADLKPVEFPILSKNWKKEEEAQAKLSEKESFSCDLSMKVNEDVVSQDFCWHPCNCDRASKVDDRCTYNENCHAMVIVYQM